MKCRVIYKLDGSVSIVHPALKSRRPFETEEKWLERVFKKATPPGLDYEDIESNTLPQERKYRNAWRGNKQTGLFVANAEKDIIDAEDKISLEIKKSQREQAIEKLKDVGELPNDY